MRFILLALLIFTASADAQASLYWSCRDFATYAGNVAVDRDAEVPFKERLERTIAAAMHERVDLKLGGTEVRQLAEITARVYSSRATPLELIESEFDLCVRTLRPPAKKTVPASAGKAI